MTESLCTYAGAAIPAPIKGTRPRHARIAKSSATVAAQPYGGSAADPAPGWSRAREVCLTCWSLECTLARQQTRDAPCPHGAKFGMSGHADIRIEVEDDPSGALADEIGRRLTEVLRRNVPPSDATPLILLAREEGGTEVGGLVGSTSYGWLLVKMLWVAEEFRGRGIGAGMMAQAEAMARARGCHGAWLDTSSARAERLYIRLGYEPFGVLANGSGDTPEGHRRAFLAKRLTDAPRKPDP